MGTATFFSSTKCVSEFGVSCPDMTMETAGIRNQGPEFHRALRLTGAEMWRQARDSAIFLQLDWKLHSRFRSSGSGSPRPLFATPTRFLL